MKSMKSHRPGDPCKTVCRPSQHHPNPAPGASPEAAAAAKKDAEKRNVGPLTTAFRKLFPTPTPTPAPQQSALALADRKDQAAKLKDTY